jgi:iron complex transport system substrate-binding protein
MGLISVHSEITGSIVEASIQLHRDLGPGLFESAYETLLADELDRGGHRVERQVIVPLTYRGRTIPHVYRLDLLVDRFVIVEIKCTERAVPIHKLQLLTYLRLMRLQVGLVLNFGLETMKQGIDRVYNNTIIP